MAVRLGLVRLGTGASKYVRPALVSKPVTCIDWHY